MSTPARALRALIKKTPGLGPLARRIAAARRRPAEPLFTGSADYWERRYAAGHTSGAGSYGEFAEFKAEVVNGFIAAHDVRTVIELGCGDGNQLALASYPSYLGFDVSPTIVELCRERFRSDTTKSFDVMNAYAGQRAELALSLDVIYHLVEDEVFESYMHRLFDAAERFVVVYSSDHDEPAGLRGPQVRHRRFTAWVEANQPAWRLAEHIENRTVADPGFFIYEPAGPGPSLTP